jgi:hypothetical protein
MMFELVKQPYLPNPVLKIGRVALCYIGKTQIITGIDTYTHGTKITGAKAPGKIGIAEIVNIRFCISILKF